MSTVLDPRVLDASTLQPKATSAIYLPVGIEGQADGGGSAVVGTLYAVNRLDEAATLFGAASPIYRIIKAVVDRGAGPIVAVASDKGNAPVLAERQTAWANLETDESIRLRLTDSDTQADLVALAESCENANLLFNKQIALMGMPAATTEAGLIAAAGAIAATSVEAATRACLVGPAVYDSAGALQSGSYAAACVAAEIAKNADPSSDLDLWPIPGLTGVELAADGLPLFRRKVVAGVAENDYEQLLQGGVSPLQPTRVAGGVMTTHLRTVYTTNGTFDNLYTRIIEDQVFIDVKNYLLSQNFLRAGNTEATRLRMKSGVEATLAERESWIARVEQPDGTRGYNVSVTSSADKRQVTIGYEGEVVRGISSIRVAANLSIAV